MEREVIADKYALLKTMGSNGISITYLVEDTLTEGRAVVKVSDSMGSLALEYIKTINLAKESAVTGLVYPSEGGLADEGYYLAFPEVGEPSLENYLRIGVPFTCLEAVRVIEEILVILEGLHRAGFYHLFVETRNIFYRPRGRILLKDPALREEFFHPLLELVSSPDFSYLSPRVMDGGELGPEADIYGVGRLAERLLEEAVDSDSSPASRRVGRVAELFRRDEGAGKGMNAAEAIACMRDHVPARPDSVTPVGPEPHGSGEGGGVSEADMTARDERSDGSSRPGRDEPVKGLYIRRALMVMAWIPLLFMAFMIVMNARGGRGGAAAGSSAGGSAVGYVNTAVKPVSKGGPEPAEEERETGEALEPDAQPAEGEMEESPSAPAGEERTAEAERTAAEPAPAEAPEAVSPASPVASFTLSPMEGRSPLQVYLDASGSYDPDGSILSYSWSFGGGGSSLYHVFESSVIPARVPVTLTVTDDGGHTSSATRYVTLY